MRDYFSFRCSLGDVTNNDDHYKKALVVSNNKSARAMRSLARSAYNRNDFYTSKILWESALSLNSLVPDGWFAYGTAAWKVILQNFKFFHIEIVSMLGICIITYLNKTALLSDSLFGVWATTYLQLTVMNFWQ
jgi:hypothetical protein